MLLLFLFLLANFCGRNGASRCQSGHVRFGKDCVPKSIAFKECMTFLEKNLPSYDLANKATLGFANNNEEIDGLQNGKMVTCDL